MKDSQKAMKQSTDTWVAEYVWLSVRHKHYPIYISFPTTPILSAAAEDFRSHKKKS